MSAYAWVAGLSGYSSRNETPESHDLPIRGSRGIAPRNGIPAANESGEGGKGDQRVSRPYAWSRLFVGRY